MPIHHHKKLERTVVDDFYDYIRKRGDHLELCEKIRKGKVKVTEEMLASVTNTKWKQEMVEAICLSKVSK